MKKLISTLFIALAGLALTVATGAAAPVRMDIAYLNHGPLQPTLREIRALIPEYGDKLVTRWYDLESEKGDRFKAKMKIRGHTPLAIYLNGDSTVQVNDRSVTFYGFPTGSGPAFFQGKWKMDDLKAALDQMTNDN